MREDIAAFSNWISQSVFSRALAWAEELTEAMSRGRWDQPESEQTQQAWSQLQALANDAVDSVYELKERVPPPLLIAHHRVATRVVEHFVRHASHLCLHS